MSVIILLSAHSPGANSKWSCPEEGLCGRMATEEDGEEEERSMKLCRAGGGGGGGWDGGRLLKGSSNAKSHKQV